MDNILIALIFTLPGMVTYFLIQLFGVTPVTKHNPSEMAAISALLWLPVAVVVLLGYQAAANLTHLEALHPYEDWPFIKKNWLLLEKVSDFKDLFNRFYFLSYYLISSFLLCYLLSKYAADKGHEKVLNIINKDRERRGKAPLSNNATVWDELFCNNEPQIVSIAKIDSSEKAIYGEVKNVSRPLEPGQNLLLKNVYHWQPVMERYNVTVEEVFIDTKSGMIIKIFNNEQALIASDMYLANPAEILTSSLE